MKINHKIFDLVGAMGLLFAGCSTDGDLTTTFHDDANAVRITAEVGKTSVDGFTRSNPLGATEEEQAKFNDGDKISVKAEGQDAVTYMLVGNEWQPQEGKYLKWESDEMNFTAYYPETFDGTLKQPTEYTSEASLAAADFMSFTGKKTKPADNTLTLSMERQMARVVINIAGFKDQYAANTVVNSVTINGDVKAYKHSDGKFYALMVPCDAQTDKQFLRLSVGDNNKVETVKGIPALEAGKSYTYQLTVGKNKVAVNGINVEDWTTGATIEGGEPTWIPYVSFTAAETQTFKMTTSGNYAISNLWYSLDGNNWTAVEKDKGVEFGGAKGCLFLRGKNPNGTGSYPNYSTITFTNPDVKVACTGDIRTLLDWEKYKTVDTKDACFIFLFNGCKVLTSAPDLPGTTLAEDCYYFMFQNCTSLKVAPALPATKLADNCYCGMFDGCTSLETAPELPATNLPGNCYNAMFYGCSKLMSFTLLVPKTSISNYPCGISNWLEDAGTDATSRTLKVKDKDAYDALVTKGLDANWKTDNCTVLDENGNEIKNDE